MHFKESLDFHTMAEQIDWMYLPKDVWSPRYDTNFYSVKVEGFGRKQSLVPGPNVGGNSNLPACYYKINVYRGHETKTVWRRYSQFKWLHQQLHRASSFPPGTCPWQKQDDEFCNLRKDELQDYVDAALEQPENARHAAVVAFLELETPR